MFGYSDTSVRCILESVEKKELEKIKKKQIEALKKKEVEHGVELQEFDKITQTFKCRM